MGLKKVLGCQEISWMQRSTADGENDVFDMAASYERLAPAITSACVTIAMQYIVSCRLERRGIMFSSMAAARRDRRHGR